MFCGQCGAEIKPNAKFCTACGAKAPAGSGAPAASVAQQPAQKAAQQPAQQPVQQPVQQAYGTQTQPPTQPIGGSRGGASAALTSKRIGVIALCAVAVLLAAIAAFFLFNRMMASAPADKPAKRPTSTTITLEYKGGTVETLPHPTFFDDVPETTVANLTMGAPSGNVDAVTIEPGLANVSNPGEIHLSETERQLIEKNGFSVAIGMAGDEFFREYETNRYSKQPNFVTVDSMMHTYHLYFSHLMKTTERTSLSDQISQMSTQMLAASQEQLTELKGTEWEDAARRNVVFFAVGARLMDPSATVPDDVQSTVSAELDKISAASGISDSAITGGLEDYSQYKPRGYYAGDEQLERYFRAMMWYGRTNFAQKDEDLDRSAALMSIALNDHALDAWQKAYSVSSFFAGESDDCGYYEYYPLVEAAYGKGVKASDLPGNEEAWNGYRDLTSRIEAPLINSIVQFDTGEGDQSEDDQKGFRVMGQRFSIDARIFNQLIYSRVGANSSGAKRMLPNALDVPAAMGSDEALAILEEKGETGYSGYSENMQELRDSISDDDESQWNSSLYSQWLHTLNPLLQVKGEGYPSFMQSKAWTRKNLQTYLGSYTELKHDTVLYMKQAMAEMGGMIPSKDDRGYVEVEPEVFARLAQLTQATKSGLEGYGMLSSEDAENLDKLRSLSEQLATMASKELQGEGLTDGEYEVIRGYGGDIEHFWREVHKDEAGGSPFREQQFPSSLVTDVATDPNGSVLELGTGKVSLIKVAVPIDGELRIAEGTVFSFYQFEQPLSDRLTDTEWREVMDSKQTEDWANEFQYKFSY